MNWIKKKYFELTAAPAINVLADKTPKYSLILSSFSREENVALIISKYSKYDCFGEIIVWHNGLKPLPLKYDTNKVRVINSDDMGLSSRYAAALLAKSETIFLHDDDLLVPEDTFVKMAHKHRETLATISIEGKNPYPDGTYGMPVKPKNGEEIT